MTYAMYFKCSLPNILIHDGIYSYPLRQLWVAFKLLFRAKLGEVNISEENVCVLAAEG